MFKNLFAPKTSREEDSAIQNRIDKITAIKPKNFMPNENHAPAIETKPQLSLEDKVEVDKLIEELNSLRARRATLVKNSSEWTGSANTRSDDTAVNNLTYSIKKIEEKIRNMSGQVPPEEYVQEAA